MKERQRQTSVFFAIPCGEFFELQNRCIKTACRVAGLSAVIVEDHSGTADLWDKITGRIDAADYFVADISSNSANVILELGYAIREKRPRYVGIFIADNARVPVDLQGFTLQKYSSVRDFQRKLAKWMVDNVPFADKRKLDAIDVKSLDFREDFKDYDRFLRLWSLPPQCSFQLTHEGLRFSNAHFPIMTTHLALLRNYEFEFKAKIESRTFGWIIKGTSASLTTPLTSYLPVFCVMFNIDEKGNLRPHIFNAQNVDPTHHYHRFDRRQVQLYVSKEGWFSLLTRVVGDRIIIFDDGRPIFEEDFATAPYEEFYQFPNKQGEVGFRCHPGEQGIVNNVVVREIDTTSEAEAGSV